MTGAEAYSLLLFTLQANMLFATGPVHSSCHRDGNFIAKNIGYSLSGTIFATHQVGSVAQCAFSCVESDLCKSYNYQHETTTHIHMCELLKKTKHEESLTTRSGYTYYETDAILCPGSECKNGGYCQADCQSEEPFCACTPGFLGSHCEVGVPPHVEVHPEEQGIVPHETAIINCYSSKAEKFVWYKDGAVLNTFSTTRVNIFPNGSLQIKDFTASDEGFYHCNVSNPIGSNVSGAVRIAELKAPKVTTLISSLWSCKMFYTTLLIKIGDFTKLDAWYKDGIEIDTSTSSRTGINKNNNFFIREPRRTDTGVYQAKVSNALGTAISDFINLTVLELCPMLSNPTNGWRKGFYAEGSVVFFQCKFKFTLVGSDTLICQANGNWNTNPPTCSADTSNNHPVRLVGSSRDNEGRVEIYSGGQWGAIGHNDWDINDATVVCKQLGFPSALHAKKYSVFGAGTGPIFLTNVQCTGSETELKDCTATYDTENSSHNKTAGVICQNVRLVGGEAYYGRLEVYTRGRWGTVCDDYWDLDDTNVVCNQLGFPGAYKTDHAQGQGVGDIVMDNVECYGRESNIMHCRHITAHNCNHGEDVSVECQSLRLTASGRYYEGRVEKFINGAWATACDDGWDFNEAIVVCKQLGFPAALEAKSQAFYGQGTGAIAFDDVNCGGSESTLSSCPRSSGHNCGHGEDAGVVCQAHVRLAGSSKYYEGRVEVFKGGTWGTVCDHLWDINDAHVVCNMLGFAGAVTVYGQAYFGQGSGTIQWDGLQCDGTENHIRYCAKSPSQTCTHNNDAGVRCQILRLAGTANSNEGRVELYKDGVWGTLCDNNFEAGEATLICLQIGRSIYDAHWNYAFYGQGQGKIHIRDLDCIRTEDSIFDCTHTTETSSCSHANDISLRCNRSTKLDSSTNKGIVRVYRDNQWSRVCGNDWDFRDAEVACREMGYTYGAIEAYVERRPDSGGYPFIHDGLHCEGHETSLTNCRQEPVGSTCTHDAGAVCQDLRLVGGNHDYEGRVELFIPDHWGTICDSEWDMKDAHVVCTQLGFKGKAKTTFSADHLALSSGITLMSGLWCTGTEENIRDCGASMNFHGCTKAKDVWVRCNP